MDQLSRENRELIEERNRLMSEGDDLAGELPVAEALPRDLLLGHEDYQGKYDPHVWMDPNLWALVVDRTRDTLVAARPEAEGTFAAVIPELGGKKVLKERSSSQ